MTLEEKFRTIYSNLPINVRAEIIVIIKDIPISWNLAFKEIENKTELSKKILEELGKLDII